METAISKLEAAVKRSRVCAVLRQRHDTSESASSSHLILNLVPRGRLDRLLKTLEDDGYEVFSWAWLSIRELDKLSKLCRVCLLSRKKTKQTINTIMEQLWMHNKKPCDKLSRLFIIRHYVKGITKLKYFLTLNWCNNIYMLMIVFHWNKRLKVNRNAPCTWQRAVKFMHHSNRWLYVGNRWTSAKYRIVSVISLTVTLFRECCSLAFIII